MAFTYFLEMGKKCLCTVYDTPEIDIHQPFKVFIAHVLDGLTQSHTGIVHDEIYFSVC